MPDTRVKVTLFPRGITVVDVLNDFVVRGFPDSVGGTA